MWWLWPHLRRFWTATGAVAVGVVATWLDNLMSEISKSGHYQTFESLVAHAPVLKLRPDLRA